MKIDPRGRERWAQTIVGLDRLLNELVTGPSATRLEHNPRLPSLPGVYLFVENRMPMYIGQTRDIRQRIANHCRPSGRDNSATFAFLIARRDHSTAVPDAPTSTRSAILSDSEFSARFAAAKKRVADMEVRFVLCDDPELRTVFEVFASMHLQTPYNDFETH